MILKMRDSIGAIGCLFVIIFAAAIWYACGLCWEYTLETWLAYAGKPQQFPFWICLLMSAFPALGQLSIVGALFTYIIMMFLK